MIKQIYYILLINLSILFAQTSMMSFYGTGEYLDSFDAISIGMGDSKYFGENSKGFSIISPSTHWKADHTYLAISLNYSRNQGDEQELKQNQMQLVSFAFPITDNKTISFGMTPLYRTDMIIHEEGLSYLGADQFSQVLEINPGCTADYDWLDSCPLSFNTSYSFSGGISEIYLSYSSNFSDNLSYGISWNKMFGTSKNEYLLNLYNVQYDNSGEIFMTDNSSNYVITKYNYSSSRYLFEIR